MDEMTKHDPDAGFEPAFAAPVNACDAHFHVFGPARKYPYGTDIRYKPPYEPLEAYLKLARRLGFVRYVFVQPERLWLRQFLHARCHARARSGNPARHYRSRRDQD